MTLPICRSPWREKYCAAKDKGFWFMPEIDNDPMVAKGRAILKQIVEGPLSRTLQIPNPDMLASRDHPAFPP